MLAFRTVKILAVDAVEKTRQPHLSSRYKVLSKTAKECFHSFVYF